MAIRIIGQKRKKVVCENCWSILEYRLEDIQTDKSGYTLWGDPCNIPYIVCSKCNKEIVVE